MGKFTGRRGLGLRLGWRLGGWSWLCLGLWPRGSIRHLLAYAGAKPPPSTPVAVKFFKKFLPIKREQDGHDHTWQDKQEEWPYGDAMELILKKTFK